MGHERIGALPKSERWRSIVSSIGSYDSTGDTIVDIAAQTTKNVRHRFQNIESDGGVFAAFKYLITLAHAAKGEEDFNNLAQQGINLSKDFNLYDLAFSIRDYIANKADSIEYSAFATQSMIETVSEWAKLHETNQQVLFDSGDRSFELWHQASDGAGFCEISRLFFSKFTERYLKYFLEREASNISNLFERIRFSENIEQHVERISKHAFETAKITQSYAAGWFNKEAKSELPTDQKIRGFLSFAFQKINSELVREETKNDEL